MAQTTEARDTVVTSDGKQLRGRVVRQDDQVVVLRVGSVDRVLPRAQVKSVDSVAAKHREFLATWATVAADDVDALLVLARRAAADGLPHEARLMYWYAALLRPRDAAIHRELGNKEQRGGFLVLIDGKWVPFEQADALGVDFDDAWRLRSEHFTCRSAAGLRQGLDVLMDLEGLYWACHQLFGQQLQLLELVEPIDVRLYRERKQMPNLSNNVGAYFDEGEPALFTCIERGEPYALIHEATHGLLHYFFVRAAKGRGGLPAWLDEGWAEYMSGRVAIDVPGKAKVRDDSVQPAHVAALAAAGKDELYGVHRLLNFKAMDFSASTRQEIKYAQAWVLYHYLFHHRDGKVRAAFAEYLRAAAQGQGQASTFRKLFAPWEKQLETEPWG